MPDIDAFTEGLKEYLDDQAVNLVRQAYFCAEKAHEGQFRRSGEPYIIHPLAVAKILAGLRMDPQTLMAALLHDVIEDTDVEKEELAAQFGDVVAELVDGVSKLTQIEFKSKAEAQAENFRKMTLAMANDIRVILVKLADRLHNMRTLGPLNPEKRRRIATETLDIYAPIANRLGINSIRIELEDLGFAALYPMRAKYIRKAVQNLRGNHQEIIGEIKERLEEKLSERDLDGVIIGREKHLNSIYQKMKYKHKSFHEIMDVYAFRIVTDSEDSCYRILGAVHSLYKPMPGRFKDYIAMPKANGYQSLHTTLFGLHVNIEIQIRTTEMETLANNGIAAHWLYKSSSPDVAAANQVRVDRWMKGLMEMRERADDSMEFIEDVKIDLFPDEIYVFTPKGKILELPAGATPVDFAYSIHTDVGNACVACRINKILSPLSVPLQSGQTIEVITAPGAKPSMSWLNFVVTGKAKSGIRHFLKEQKQSESSGLGRLLLRKSLNSFGKDLDDIPAEQINRVVQHNKVGSFDDILEEIGLGSRMSYIVARQLVQLEDSQAETEDDADDENQASLTIKGAEGLLVSFAQCCKPIPGDPIVGVMGQGNGMMIHAENCDKLSLKGSEQQDGKSQGGRIALDWAKDITDEFSVELKVALERHRGIIAELASAVTMADANIEKINVDEQNSHLSVISLIVHVKGRRHLARLMRRIRNMKAVINISRVKN